MTYYRLLDDLDIPGRWHLGEVIDRGHRTTLEFGMGACVDDRVLFEAEITHPGKSLDFCLTGRSYRLKDHAAIATKEGKNKKAKSKSNEPLTAELAS